jgi:drug/metabolite transporter (DMT)-like permease
MPQRPPNSQVHLALITTQIFFASLSVVGKEAMLSLPWPAFTTFRIGFSALFFLALYLASGAEPVEKKDRKTLALYGLLGVAANQFLFLAGLTLSKATHATILVTSIPVFSALLAALLGRELLTAKKGLGIMVSLAGALGLVVLAALSSGKDFGLQGKQVFGNLLVLINSFCYSLYLVLSKDLLGRYKAITVTFWMFLYGLVEVLLFDLIGALLVPGSFTWVIDGILHTTLGAWLRLAYIVCFATVLAYGLNSWALRFAPMSLVAVYIYVQPLVAVVLAYFLLGETLHLQEALAAILIIAGVRIVAKENAKRQATKAEGAKSEGGDGVKENAQP